MKRLAVYFENPREISVRREEIPALKPNQVLVKTVCSGISAGTEMLVYRGQWPDSTAVDATIASLQGGFAYPLKYGYAAAGTVVDRGNEVDQSWIDRSVFAFNPHESYFIAEPEQLVPVESDISPEAAVFLPNMETAVNFVMDGKPVIGEQIAVFGQGVVGLLTTGLLARFPLTNLIAVDFFDLRRAKAAELGAKHVLDPATPTFPDEICAILGRGEQAGADLAYELSGNPAALDQALDAMGFGGRIVIGSWYGAKRADIDLGGRFHRNRIRILSSQVSTIGPEFMGLWTKTRRLSLARQMLVGLSPESLITHRFDVTDAADAYALTAERPESVIQVIITYED